MRAVNTQMGRSHPSVCPVSVAHLQGDPASFLMWPEPEAERERPQLQSPLNKTRSCKLDDLPINNLEFPDGPKQGGEMIRSGSEDDVAVWMGD